MLELILKNFLLKHYYTLLSFHFILILIFFWENWKGIKKEFKKIRFKSWIIIFFIFLLSLFLRTNLSAYDDFLWGNFEYRLIAKHFTHDLKPTFCEYGSYNQCLRYRQSFLHPVGYSYILSFPFLLFGVSENVIYNFNILLSGLSTILIFLFTYQLFKKEDIALISAFILCMLPWHIYFSGTGKSETTSLFFLILTGISIFSRINKNLKGLFLSLLLILFSAEIRIENIILLIPFSIFNFENLKNNIKNLKEKYDTLYLLLIFLVLIPIFYFVFLFGEFRGIYKQNLSYSTILSYTKILFLDLSSLLGISSLFIYITIFLSIIFWEKRKNLIYVLWIWIIIYSLTYIFYQGILERYFFHIYPPIISLISLGLITGLKHIFKKYTLILPFFIVAFLFFPSINLLNEGMFGYPEDIEQYNEISKIGSLLDGWVICDDPNVCRILTFLYSNKKTYWAQWFEEKNYKNMINEGEVYFIDTPRDYIDFVQKATKKLNENFNIKFLFESKSIRVYKVLGYKQQ